MSTLLGWAACSPVVVYHPISGFQDPTVVDPTAPNFQDMRLVVRCVGDKALSRTENRALCRRVGRLFENQGATVETIDWDGPAMDPFAEEGAKPEPPDLQLEIVSRRLHRNNPTLSRVASVLTFTLVAEVREETFAQDITIRDGDGFLLVEDTLVGRVVERRGAGVWAMNHLADWLVREEPDKVMKGAAGRDLSEDMYRQISQLAFNARMRRAVLLEANEVAGPVAPPSEADGGEP